MYTVEDYYMPDGCGCPADWVAQDDVDWLCEEFYRFLRLIDCEYDPYCDGWQWNYRHDVRIRPMESVLVPREVGDFSNDAFRGIWERHFPRMRAMYDYMERVRDHLDEAPYEYCRGYVRRHDLALARRLEIVERAYDEYVDKVLDLICEELMRQLDDACEDAFSKEAAERWVKHMNEEAA